MKVAMTLTEGRLCECLCQGCRFRSRLYWPNSPQRARSNSPVLTLLEMILIVHYLASGSSANHKANQGAIYHGSITGPETVLYLSTCAWCSLIEQVGLSSTSVTLKVDPLSQAFSQLPALCLRLSKSPRDITPLKFSINLQHRL